MALPTPTGWEHNPGCTYAWRTLLEKTRSKLVNFTKVVIKLGKDEPRRAIHSFKVGLALVLVSILQHLRPSFYGFGDNVVWAVITVVLVLEVSVGATLGKGLNRVLATLLAGALGVAIRRIASFSGNKGKAVLSSTSVFFVENELLEVAQERLLTIIIGSFIAVMVSICICPVWVGQDLHNQIAANIEKLSDFFQGFGDEYFNNLENTTEAMGDKPFLHTYESVLSSKSSEETMAVLARWEPCHGRFRFHHPWKQYLKIGNQIRLCAFKVKALSVFLLRSDQTPYEFRRRIQESSTNISMESGKALKESSLMLKHMAKPSSIRNAHVANAKTAAESLKSVLRTNPWEGADNLEIIAVATVASLLIDVVVCVDNICQAVDEVATLAKFVPSDCCFIQEHPIPNQHVSIHVINHVANSAE
ncbi:hypothetical protein Fmac_019468 [Flemingia macrophylla]|uniref:Aluminum-activated malate transporter n=1 Tax=Flemingia macrophylla TaxID=520843 RepID=A0ABD1M7W2_9FABA